MDLLNDFLNINNAFNRVIVPGSSTGGRLQNDPDDFPNGVQQTEEEGELGTDYAKAAQEEEERALQEGSEYGFDDVRSIRGGFRDIDDTLSAFGPASSVQLEDTTKVYSTYDFSHRIPVDLPIEAYKERILSFISTTSVCIIQGATGCGKTTQVPQYILDDCQKNVKPCNIIVTQPRRLAAISVARRVCKERKWTVGGIVGFQVGLNACTSPDTRLLFCTTGVLLQKLIAERSVMKYSHIILDEVHERDEDMDFTMMVVRKLIRQSAADTKVILMSATLDPDKYRLYFGSSLRGTTIPAPFIDLDQDRKKKHVFTVSTYYLSHLQKLGDIPDIDYDEPAILPQTLNLALKLVQGFDNLEKLSQAPDRGAVLVFLPGIQEIEEFYNLLTTKAGQSKLWVRPLHSTITTDEQEQVFFSPPKGYRKVILSTNIAESSLTVPDIVYVIDFCLTKQLVCDPTTNFCSLQISWVSKTNCIQRAGRAGRVRDGRVYRLVPQDFYEDYMPSDLEPEILRCPIDRTILMAKILKMGPPKHLLGLCLDPPDLANIRSTIRSLKEAGALLKTVNGVVNPEDGDITWLGQIMAKLPLDIHVSKFIVLGHLFNLLDDCIIIGAALSLKNMFSSPFREQMSAYQSRLTWADGSCSDCVAFLHAYKMWQSHRNVGNFTTQYHQKEEAWAHRYFVQLRTLKEVATLVKELTQRLHGLSIESTGDKALWTANEKYMVLRFVIAGAFYPNYFVRSSQGGQVDEEAAVRQIACRDPCNTVFLEGMPMDQPGELYVRAIKEAFSDCLSAQMRVTFNKSSKVYVEFTQTTSKKHSNFLGDIPGNVCMPVYMAVKLRQLRVPITLHIMESDKAMAKAHSIGLTPALEDTSWRWDKKAEKEDCWSPSLPSIDTSCIYFQITHIVDPGCFYGHLEVTRDRERGVNEREMVVQMLNSDPVKMLEPLNSRPLNGRLYAVPVVRFDNSLRYYRGKVLCTNVNGDQAKVFLIDSGNTVDGETKTLREFGKDLIEKGILKVPPQVFECSLSELRPSMLMDARGTWCEDAKNALIAIKQKGNVFGKIYSVVHGVVHLEVYAEKKLPFEDVNPFESVNQYFIRKQWAERKEETFQSKWNHQLRENASNLDMEVNAQRVIQELQYDYAKDWLQQKPDPELPSPHECYRWINLKGPFSPLEMKLFALTHVGTSRAVHVDWSSVNSVLLDTDPQDPHERMMVACQVGENADRNRLNLRYTSMLPNIHGLSSIICMVFAPAVEMRVNKARTRFTGALCGLGVHPETGRPLYGDHDMEIAFDVKITLDDLQNINKLRFWLTQALLSEEDFETCSSGPISIAYCQGKVKEFFLKLLRTQRPSQEVTLYNRPYMWNQLDPDYILTPGITSGRAVYSLHCGVELEDEPKPDIRDHVNYLQDIADGRESWKDDLACQLCKVTLRNIRLLQVHLATQQHREKEKQLEASTPQLYVD